jgi:TRAP-type transport system small permease protein
VTRTAGSALFWVDEAAIYCMVWSAFLGASLTIRNRSAISLDVAKDFLSPTLARGVDVISQVIILCFGVSLLVLCWLWFDPVGLFAARFDFGAFAGSTFNFVYREPTLTLGLPKWPIWLIVPFFAFAVTLHVTANLTKASVEPAAPGPSLAGRG